MVYLSSVQIPDIVKDLLKLGENFCLPLSNTRRIVIKFIKSIEHNINKFPSNFHSKIRDNSISIIKKLFSNPNVSSNNKFVEAVQETKKFLKENIDVIFTRAGKGHTTVALDKKTYLMKMQSNFNDSNTYSVVNKDPTRKMINELHSLLTRWKKSKYIDDNIYRKLNCTEGSLPRTYGLPKLHKQNCPFRVIVSSKNSPLYALAKFLHEIIYVSIPKAQSYIANSFDLVNKLSELQLDKNYNLISLDIVSLFTNIPLDLSETSILRRWNYVQNNCLIPRDEFMSAIRLVLNSTFFTFDGVYYKQTFGTPMGSPLSPVIAITREIRGEYLERENRNRPALSAVSV